MPIIHHICRPLKTHFRSQFQNHNSWSVFVQFILNRVSWNALVKFYTKNLSLVLAFLINDLKVWKEILLFMFYVGERPNEVYLTNCREILIHTAGRTIDIRSSNSAFHHSSQVSFAILHFHFVIFFLCSIWNFTNTPLITLQTIYLTILQGRYHRVQDSMTNTQPLT